MHIMFLTHYFPPEVNAPASRTFEHARMWRDAGHRVTIVTCAPNHPKGELYEGYRNRLWAREDMEGIEVHRLWTYLSANEGFVRRSLNFVSYLAMATLVAPFLPRPDVVVSTSPQFFCGLAGYTVSRIKRRPWALEIRDLWPETILTVGAMKKGALVVALERLADWCYRTADWVIPLTDTFREHIVARGGRADRMTVIKNGVDLAQFGALASADAFRARHGLTGKCVAAYVGTHGMCQKLDTVLEAAARLRDRPDIAVLLVGGGAERARLLALKEKLKLDNVLMLDQLPKSAMPEVIAASDISLVVLMKDDLFKSVIPSKLFESLAMERPVILGVEGESRQLLLDAQAGVAVEPENAEELATAIATLADDKDLRQKLGRHGSLFVRAHFDRRHLAQLYIDALTQAVGVGVGAGGGARGDVDKTQS